MLRVMPCSLWAFAQSRRSASRLSHHHISLWSLLCCQTFIVGMTDTAGSSAPLNLGGETKTALQLRRLQEANAKYKKLLQLAKDRIQQQEEELQAIREENNQHEVNATKAAESINIDEEPVAGAGEQLNVGQVCQLVKQVDAKRGLTEIWALLETEAVSTDDQGDYGSSRRYKEWKRFDTETQLQVRGYASFSIPICRHSINIDK
jgi:hypothetical protein